MNIKQIRKFELTLSANEDEDLSNLFSDSLLTYGMRDSHQFILQGYAKKYNIPMSIATDNMDRVKYYIKSGDFMKYYPLIEK